MTPLPLDTIVCGDCYDVLKNFQAKSVDLIITSPPYADARLKTYGGINPDNYVEWFIPKAKEFYRMLKPSGTFILNIKEKAVNGERHTYVLDLIKALKEQGWLWTEEYIWVKKTSYPGKWPNRFRDAWERCLQFNKQRSFVMNQDAVKIPINPSTLRRVEKLSPNDTECQASSSQSGLSRRMANWVDRTTVYPHNVLYLAPESSNQHHSAVFPLSLPTWFIKLFTREGDIVLDPFLGSGTTAVACRQLNRHYIGVDINAEYCALAQLRLDNALKRN